MQKIKLTIHHLYQESADGKQDARATARIYAGDRLILTETMAGQAQHYPRYLSAADDNGEPLRVEWESDGCASMSVTRAEVCPCCGGDEWH
ncbi:hypothetical protein CYR32_01080 [Chimaeribacter coloradensis]|uniref:Uncharacterized protein n=1 Tax=Chimaeribacter coloradensis TaxID=2060068 RepID=A0A2N5ECU9_9GAMM|nr:hypothetical protein [Chimaeribacter coloradensis]PLR40364.1 hypothetical protein CYR32_01080 [Chimaeribacter coloradensis]